MEIKWNLFVAAIFPALVTGAFMMDHAHRLDSTGSTECSHSAEPCTERLANVALWPRTSDNTNVGELAEDDDVQGTRKRVARQIDLGDAIRAGFEDIYKEFEITNRIEKDLLVFACKTKVRGGSPNMLSIVLFQPKGCTSRRGKVDKTFAHSEFTLRMIRVVEPNTTAPLAVITYTEMLNGHLGVEERIVTYEGDKGWRSR